MKSVRIIALKKDRKRILEHLQNSSLVEVKHNEVPHEGFERVDTASQLQRFERNNQLLTQALKILDKISPEKKSMLDSFKGKREIEPEDLGSIAAGSPRVISICSKICDLEKQKSDYMAERIRLKALSAQLEPWGSLDIPLNTPDTATTAILIGTFPKMFDESALSEALAEEKDLVFDSEIFFSSVNLTCAVIYVPKAQKEKAENVLRTLGFTRPLNPTSRTPAEKIKRLAQKDKELSEKIDKTVEDINKYVKYRQAISDTKDYFVLRSDKYKVISELDQSSHTFILYGYIPECDCDKLEELCLRAADCIVEFSEAGDDAPVKLKNNSFTEPAESIVMMYSPPSKEDIDPTPILAIFYYFFFGMMFSDAGYGLVLIIATTIGLKVWKPDKSMRNNLKLFRNCGYATVFWGLAFGSIFGNAPAVFYKLFTGQEIKMAQLLPWPILDTQKDALTIMILSIGLGLVHILVGMGCKFYVCLKNKRYAEAFFDTGLWMLMLIGFAVLAAGMVISPVLMTVGEIIAIACAVGLILTQGRSAKGIFGKLIGGVASLYDITSYVSDLLSYSRLLALGLTTGVMAQVFNMLSTLMGTSVFGIIFMIVLFIAGHLITIGLNALGSYVHTMRLQYVEMFSKFYEGGGRKFEPFAVKCNNFKMKNSEEI